MARMGEFAEGKGLVKVVMVVAILVVVEMVEKFLMVMGLGGCEGE